MSRSTRRPAARAWGPRETHESRALHARRRVAERAALQRQLFDEDFLVEEPRNHRESGRGLRVSAGRVQARWNRKDVESLSRK